MIITLAALRNGVDVRDEEQVDSGTTWSRGNGRYIEQKGRGGEEERRGSVPPQLTRDTHSTADYPTAQMPCEFPGTCGYFIKLRRSPCAPQPAVGASHMGP